MNAENNFTDYFDVDEPTEPMPTPPKEEPIVEEKPVDPEQQFIDALEKAIQNQETIADLPREKLIEMLREKKEALIASRESAKQAKVQSEKSKEFEKQVKILKGAFNPATSRADNPLETPEQKARRENAENYKKVVADQIQADWERKRKVSTPVLEIPKGKKLEDLTIDERREVFKKAGLVKDSKPPR